MSYFNQEYMFYISGLIAGFFISSIIGPVKQNDQRKIAIIYSSISLNMCFGCSSYGCSNELSH